jgi:streptogrisin C
MIGSLPRPIVTMILAATAVTGAVTPASAAAQVATLDRTADSTAIAAVERSLSDRLGSSFANVWLDASTGKLTVGVTDPSRAREVRAAGAVPRVVRHSAAELDAMKSRLDASTASAPRSVTGWHVDVTTNSVVVSVLGADQAAAAAWASGAGATTVRIEHVAAAPRPLWNLLGGERLDVRAGTCSIGCNARSGSTR